MRTIMGLCASLLLLLLVVFGGVLMMISADNSDIHHWIEHRNEKLVLIDARWVNTGPFIWNTRYCRVYRVTAQDKKGFEHVYWFREGAFTAEVIEHTSSGYITRR